MALFLEDLLQERSSTLKKFLSETDGAFVCRCYPAGSDIDQSGDKIFQISPEIKFADL